MSWWRPELTKRAEQWTFGALKLDQIPQPERIVEVKPDEYYLRVWLRSLWIANVRRGLNQFYGAVHSFISLPHESGEVVTFQKITTPHHLKKADPKRLNRVILIDEPLLSGVPYKGGNLAIEVGLFSIQSDDLAEPYLSLLEKLSALAGVSYASVAKPYVEPIKYGIGLLTDSNDSEILEIGLKISLNPPRTGWFVVLGAPTGSVDLAQLKVASGDYHLIDQAGNALQDHAYMVFSIEAVPNRDDWYTIPDLQQPYQQLLRDVRTANTRYLESLAVFKSVAGTCPDLVPGDAKRIAKLAEEKAKAGFEARQTSAAYDAQIMPELRDLPLYPNPDRVIALVAVAELDIEPQTDVLYINLWIEDEREHPLPQPAVLIKGDRYIFLFAIESRSREEAAVTERFTEPQQLQTSPETKVIIELICPFLDAANEMGYVRHEVNYRQGLGFPPQKFVLKPYAVGRFYLTARLLVDRETIYREVLALQVEEDTP